jgi:hypothetical protein
MPSPLAGERAYYDIGFFSRLPNPSHMKTREKRKTMLMPGS